jgi:hypothetical protein
MPLPQRRKTTSNSVFFSFVYDDLGVSLWVIMGKNIYQIFQFLMFVLYFTTFIVAFWLPKKRETPDYLKNFYYFPLVGSIVTFIIFLSAYKLIPYIFSHHVNTISIFFHYFFLGRFIYIVCDKVKPVKMTAIVFFIITTFFIVYDFIHLSFIALSVSNASLLVLCLFYFYGLFISKPKLKLTKEPSFWICSGIFFGSGFIIPSTILMKHFAFYFSDLKYFLAMFSCLGFAMMYIFFIKAFLCLPTLRKS